MKTIIIVLSILLGLSLTALLGVIIYSQVDSLNTSAVVPDNYIESTDSSELDTYYKVPQLHTKPLMLCVSLPNANFSRYVSVMALSKTIITSDSAKEIVISIYKNQAEDSTPFDSENMFPGDRETKAYLVEVSHRGTVTVCFHADIRAGYEKLAEVLKCTVVLRGENKTLYDGLMRDMPESLNHRISSIPSKTSELTYDITVYLDTDIGNEYMNKELVADFRWWVEENGNPPIPSEPGETTELVDTTNPDVGELVYPPQTGDNFRFYIWFWIAMFSLFVNITLLWTKRLRNDGEKEEMTTNE